MFGARWQTSSDSSGPLRYLALGDSYTTCTGDSGVDQSWPEIVARRLAQRIGRKAQVTNPAVNGLTILGQIDKEHASLNSLLPCLICLLGVFYHFLTGRLLDLHLPSLAP